MAASQNNAVLRLVKLTEHALTPTRGSQVSCYTARMTRRYLPQEKYWFKQFIYYKHLFRNKCIITSSTNKSGIYIQIMGSCWGLEFQLSVPTHSKTSLSVYVLRSQRTIALRYKPSTIWCHRLGGTQFTSNTPAELPVDSSINDNSRGCLDGVSNSGNL